MKRLISLLLAFVMCGTVCACKDTTQTNDSDALPSDDQVSSQVSDEQAEKNTQGTRSNPYHFGEDIVFSTMYNEEIITYTINFSEIIQGYATRNLLENSSTIDETTMLIRGTISVNGEYDEGIYAWDVIRPILLDENFNEFPFYSAQTPAKSIDEKNNLIFMYCGGIYDTIFELDSRGMNNKVFSYLKLNIENLYVGGECEFSGSLWITFPLEDELSNGQFFYTGRAFEGEPIIGSWSDVATSSDYAVFYEDGTLEIIKGMWRYKGTWEYLEEEIEINSEDMINPRTYIATMDDSSFMAVIVFDNPNFGDGEKDNMVIVENSYSMSSYTRDQ